MAKIVYGVSGEGSGHSSRSREMLTHLKDLGHDVMVVSYDRGYNNLKDDFDVFETEGLHIASLDNPLLIGTSFVVYIHMPTANYTVASSLAGHSLPTHHTI